MKKKNAIYITCICVIHTVDLTLFDTKMFILHIFFVISWSNKTNGKFHIIFRPQSLKLSCTFLLANGIRFVFPFERSFVSIVERYRSPNDWFWFICVSHQSSEKCKIEREKDEYWFWTVKNSIYLCCSTKSKLKVVTIYNWRSGRHTNRGYYVLCCVYTTQPYVGQWTRERRCAFICLLSKFMRSATSLNTVAFEMLLLNLNSRLVREKKFWCDNGSDYDVSAAKCICSSLITVRTKLD